MTDKKIMLDINGVPIYCRIRGNGTPILMIHGAVCDSDFFEDTSEILARNHQVICYDRRGYSRSGGEIDSDFLTVEAQDAAVILQKLTPGLPAIVIGCSAGALIAMKLANLYPELLSLLIIHEPPMTAFLPEDSDVFTIADKINIFIAQEKYGRAFNKFLLLLDDSDPRAKPKSEQVLLREERNMIFFIKNEFSSVFTKDFPPEIPPAVPAVICIGDNHANNFLYQTAEVFSKKYGIPLIHFPGRHNCAYELPLDFAVGIEGIIKIWI